MASRTDLAVELASPSDSGQAHGITVKELVKDSIKITTVSILDENGERSIGKAIGEYITVETAPFASANIHSHEEIGVIAAQLSALLPSKGTVLVVGLGNEHITPDALGPRAVDLIIATRHISGSADAGGFAGFRPVAALSPGVLGQTGIESSEIIAAVVADISPVAVIVIDALASRSVARLGSTLQMASSGISPGAGVQNNRKELSRKTLGVPVISMGIPTVVDAGTLVHELTHSEENTAVDSEIESMVVTPRDIDLMVDRGAKLIALSINLALQPHLTLEDITYLIS